MKIKPINECPVPKGLLLVIGGKENRGEEPEKEVQKDNPERLEILKTFIKLTGKNAPVIEVISTASSLPDELFKEYNKAFTELGAKEVNQIHHENRDNALKESESCIERIKKADGIFFTGGDQLKLTTIYGGTPLLFELKIRYIRDGALIAGTSAGAMALSTPMIYAGNEDVQQISGEIKITTGLEFLKDVCIDTHFVDRGRFVRMAQVIATNPACVGLGIEEDTALIVRNGLEAEVIGSGVVVVIDGQQIKSSNILNHGEYASVSIKGLQVDLLSRGDKYVIPQTNPPHI
ncbi:cyanophycinase [Desertivirga arenae]|uniref:cyanophycinase n=1 Tax=Desertivirga arenae TaxID=2810309 RepID=UPI001A96A6EF|nr:cyanophycinase [Pedobacter sp. SYSU D00823]